MENNFDKSIKKLLENYEVEYRASDWDRMEQKIEEQAELSPEMEDVLLDGTAYDSLYNFSVDYNPEHWDLMQERLNDPYALRRRLMKYKVAEVALVLLFILTLIQFLPIKNISSKKNIAQQAPDQIIQEENTLLATPDLQTDLTVLNKKDATRPKALQQKSTVNTINPSSQAETKNLFNNNVVLNAPESNHSSEVVPIIHDSAKTLIADDDFKKENIASGANTMFAEEGIPENENTGNTTETVAKNVNNYALGMMQSIPLKAADNITVPGVDQFSNGRLFEDLKKPIRVRIGMSIGPDANYVMTPHDRGARLEQFNQLALGYSGGFTLGFQYDNWEIETGALYSAINYDSRNIFQIKGSFAEGGYVEQGLIGAELDIVRIPVNLRYNFFKKKKWNFYAYSGASLNFAVETFYHFTTRDIGQSDASRNFVAPSRNPRSPEESSRPYSHAAYDGLFEGGTISNNTFLTANLGFGIERFFTPRMSIFFQPGYQYQFTNGLGPQSDRVNSLSIMTGAKVTLKKRKKK